MREASTHFRCVPLGGGRLSRAACAGRHRATQTLGPGKVPQLRDETCHSCRVGAAHARGEAPTTWPDGMAIEFSNVTTRNALVVLEPAAQQEPTMRCTICGETGHNKRSCRRKLEDVQVKQPAELEDDGEEELEEEPDMMPGLAEAFRALKDLEPRQKRIVLKALSVLLEVSA